MQRNDGDTRCAVTTSFVGNDDLAGLTSHWLSLSLSDFVSGRSASPAQVSGSCDTSVAKYSDTSSAGNLPVSSDGGNLELLGVRRRERLV